MIVYSLDFVVSLTYLLSTIAKLGDREITLKSIKEPWLDHEVTDTRDLFEKLSILAQAMHSSRTREGLTKARAKARSKDTKLGRKPTVRSRAKYEQQILTERDTIRATRKISIAKACQAIGVPSTRTVN